MENMYHYLILIELTMCFIRKKGLEKINRLIIIQLWSVSNNAYRFNITKNQLSNFKVHLLQ
jgi:hypothetical protein